MGHKLLPPRTPNGAKIEELIKQAYQLEEDKEYYALVSCWFDIIKTAEEESRRVLLLAYPE